ncbi:STAS domain-containing protein [Sediminibacillus albus]|uniref:Anti-anti-sigma regulatory factor (Antagonist of anti-sigma factor) n=1 Tax=Sediminibacillus albus TaxID=407036 RepID=A0A1G8XGV6_9BACI|nr:STAS domain-containing protein [Sediminibacillus albus]SDJ89808.1 Anti-anti-sigma regulatory factor (antagonist of anti-sigma factor) [Sediminibacillus albus]
MGDSIIDKHPSYTWIPGKGSMRFEGQDVIIFWIETAMKSFLDTIEEVSGDAAANIVMETAGFRMGKIVSDFFKQDSIENVVHSLPEIYAAAGWCELEIVDFSAENETALIRMKNSWEYKVNKLQRKEKMGTFLAGHFAGTLTGLFNRNTSFSVVKSQLTGDEYDEIRYFPSNGSPIKDIHSFIRQNEQDEIQRLERKVEERTETLMNLVKEISSPLIPVLDGIVVMPLIGKYDEARADDLFKRTMEELPAYEANFLILDVTGLDSDIDAYSISLLQSLTNSSKLLGTKSVIVGISPKLSMKLTESNIEMQDIDYFSTLKHAIHFALAQEGKQIIG